MENAEIAAVFEEVADLLAIQDANPFRVRAYENAARTIAAQARPIREMVEAGEDLTDLPDIGKEMASHITELVLTGRLSVLEELTRDVPRSLTGLVQLPGVGPRKARKLWKERGITTIDELERAARSGTIADLEGFGRKTQEKILQGIAQYRQHTARMKLSDADEQVEPLLAYLRREPAVERVEVAGSYRRRVETIGDLDLLVTADDADAVVRHFTGYPRAREVQSAGTTKSTVVLASGLQVDLRILAPDTYGAALQHFTGSKQHNVAVRKRAVARGLRVSEYGVFRVPPDADPDEADPHSGERIAGQREEEVYAALDLAWVPPELREDRGELEAAAAGTLPALITLEDIRGDLQMHSTWSDGRNSVAEMVEACVARGYEYMAITDHSPNLAMIQGLDRKGLLEQWTEIAQLRERHPDIRILRSLEIDILKDGSLDLDDDLLAQLDMVLVSIHSHFDLPAAEQTKRITRALEHGRVHILAHPTGRKINRREPMAFDLDDVLACAKAHGVAMELNANPDRLDLKDTQLMHAGELGIPIVINTDAHRIRDLDFMRYGVDQARRAWLEARDVINAWPWKRLVAFLGSSRPSPPARKRR